MEATVSRWKELPLENPIPNLDRKRILGERMMLAMVTLHPGCVVETHRHENEQFAYIISGKAVFGIGEEGSESRYEIILGEGEVLHLPSNIPHSVRPLEKTLVLDLLSPPGAMGVDSQGR
jgi:quercetin dioxygenase-like cupin family protein